MCFGIVKSCQIMCPLLSFDVSQIVIEDQVRDTKFTQEKVKKKHFFNTFFRIYLDSSLIEAWNLLSPQ